VTDDGLAVLVTVTESCDPVNKVFKFDLAADGSMPAAAVARAGGNTAVTKWVDDFGAEFEYVGKRKVYRKDTGEEKEKEGCKCIPTPTQAYASFRRSAACCCVWGNMHRRCSCTFRSPFRPSSCPSALIPLIFLPPSSLPSFRRRYITSSSSQGSTSFLFKTNKDAPKYRLVRYYPSTADRSETWEEVVAERNDVLERASVVAGNKLILTYLQDCKNIVEIHTLDGGGTTSGKHRGTQALFTVPLPSLGSVVSLTGRKADRGIFLKFSSFLHPGTILRVDLDHESFGSGSDGGGSGGVGGGGLAPVPAEALSTFYETKVVGVDANDFDVKQVGLSLYIYSGDSVQQNFHPKLYTNTS
jgi:hypothetical protein